MEKLLGIVKSGKVNMKVTIKLSYFLFFCHLCILRCALVAKVMLKSNLMCTRCKVILKSNKTKRMLMQHQFYVLIQIKGKRNFGIQTTSLLVSVQVRERAAMALGNLCLGDALFPHRRTLVERFIEIAAVSSISLYNRKSC